MSVDYLFLVIIGLKAKALKASIGRKLGGLLITSSDGTVWFSKPVFSKNDGTETLPKASITNNHNLDRSLQTCFSLRQSGDVKTMLLN